MIDLFLTFSTVNLGHAQRGSYLLGLTLQKYLEERSVAKPKLIVKHDKVEGGIVWVGGMGGPAISSAYGLLVSRLAFGVGVARGGGGGEGGWSLARWAMSGVVCF